MTTTAPPPDPFRSELKTFVSKVGNKTEAAAKLGISRPDLYRYLDGKTTPRPRRRKSLLNRIAPRPGPDHLNEKIEALAPKDVALLRRMLIHLLHVVELDGRGRDRDEYGAESAHGAEAR